MTSADIHLPGGGAYLPSDILYVWSDTGVISSYIYNCSANCASSLISTSASVPVQVTSPPLLSPETTQQNKYLLLHSWPNSVGIWQEIENITADVSNTLTNFISKYKYISIFRFPLFSFLFSHIPYFFSKISAKWQQLNCWNIQRRFFIHGELSH
jgi:hypothetical protein